MKKILMIDNEKEFTKMIKIILEETKKYEVIEENEGINGYSTALRVKPDLILMDIIMQGIDGPEIAKKIQKDKNLNNVPIIFLTAAVTDQEISGGTGKIGGNRFLSKPLEIKKLFKCIEDNLA